MHTSLLQIRPSLYLAGIFLILHVLAISAIFTAQLAICWQLLMVIALAGNFYYCYKRFILQSSLGVIIKCWQHGEDWVLQTRAGLMYEAKLSGDSVISSVLLILNFKLKNQHFRKTLLVFSDSISAKQFRQLKVSLLCHHSSSPKKKRLI